MDYLYYRNLVDVCMTEDEAKAEAEEVGSPKLVVSSTNREMVNKYSVAYAIRVSWVIICLKKFKI